MRNKILTLAAATALMTGCANTTPFSAPGNNYIAQPLSASPSVGLSNAQSSIGNSQLDKQLVAITKMLQSNNINAASQALAQLKGASMSHAENAYYETLNAYLALERDNPNDAINHLRNVGSVSTLSAQQQSLYYKVAYLADARSNHPAAAAVAQIQSMNIDGNQNTAALNNLWMNLQQLSSADLNNALQSARDPNTAGWFQLAAAARSNANNPKALVNAIQQWQNRYPNHPANNLIPSGANLAVAGSPDDFKQVAVLLPLTGKFGPMGKAVLNGFMAAYYQNTTPNKPSIKVYDTNNQSVASVYQQAVSNGADFVVGPLTKEDVAVIASSGDVNVPTLTLNYTTGGISSGQLMEFGLSPAAAAAQAATQAWQHGVSKIITITPNTDWGRSTLQSFLQNWQALGGTTVGSLQLQPNNITDQIANILHVDKSIARNNQISKIVGADLAFTPRRRLDVNGIFLVATPDQAREIRPLLQFYFAGNVPVFAISAVYPGVQDSMRNRDLDGVYFNDLPFMVNNAGPYASARDLIHKNFAHGFNEFGRLYAIGMDAYLLSSMNNRVRGLPNFAVNGMSGSLILNNQRITPYLDLAHFSGGAALPTR